MSLLDEVLDQPNGRYKTGCPNCGLPKSPYQYLVKGYTSANLYKNDRKGHEVGEINELSEEGWEPIMMSAASGPMSMTFTGIMFRRPHVNADRKMTRNRRW